MCVQRGRPRKNNHSTCTATTRMDKNASSPCRDSISCQTFYSLCPNYLVNHGHCGHCFRHIHYLPGTCTGTYSVTCHDMSEVSTRGVCEKQQKNNNDLSLPLHALTKTRRLRANGETQKGNCQTSEVREQRSLLFHPMKNGKQTYVLICHTEMQEGIDAPLKRLCRPPWMDVFLNAIQQKR